MGIPNFNEWWNRRYFLYILHLVRESRLQKKYIWIESWDFEIVFMDWSSWKICLPFTETFVKVMLISR